jgi:hypothetical protein
MFKLVLGILSGVEKNESIGLELTGFGNSSDKSVQLPPIIARLQEHMKTHEDRHVFASRHIISNPKEDPSSRQMYHCLGVACSNSRSCGP